jgi:uncharacterized protein YbjT (DUF2867 family)
MASSILVTGGTGTLGSLVVARLREAGREVRVLSRHGGGAGLGIDAVSADLTSGAGVDAALHDIDTVVHCAGTRSGDEDKTLVLVRAAARAGVRHIVYISVVGVDRLPMESPVDRLIFGYFASKLAAERLVAEAGIPWTTLRATQFDQLLGTVARQMSRLPVVPVPSGFRFQPVDAGEVAARLAELAMGPPAGLVGDIAGPEVRSMADLLGIYQRVTGRRRRIVSVPVPGKAARAVREGANLSREPAIGKRTWEQFLTGQAAEAAAPEAPRQVA